MYVFIYIHLTFYYLLSYVIITYIGLLQNLVIIWLIVNLLKFDLFYIDKCFS